MRPESKVPTATRSRVPVNMLVRKYRRFFSAATCWSFSTTRIDISEAYQCPDPVAWVRNSPGNDLSAIEAGLCRASAILASPSLRSPSPESPLEDRDRHLKVEASHDGGYVADGPITLKACSACHAPGVLQQDGSFGRISPGQRLCDDCKGRSALVAAAGDGISPPH